MARRVIGIETEYGLVARRTDVGRGARLSGGEAAQSLFAPIEVDNADPAALQHWQQQLGRATGSTPTAVWQAPVFERWT